VTAGRTPLGAALRARGSRFGALLLCVDRTGSTNAVASELAKRGAPDGSLVLAERQARGRGRWNRSWASESGGLYLSVVLRTIPEEVRPELLPLSAAVAVAEALERAHGIAARLRWPNDVFVSGRKLGGVLCESSYQGERFDYAVIGIGVNVSQRLEDFPEELRGSATSVRLITGREADAVETAEAILEALEPRLAPSAVDPGSASLERFRELAEGLNGFAVRVVSREGDGFAATSEGLGDDGALRVRLADGACRSLYSEDVLLLRPAEEPLP